MPSFTSTTLEDFLISRLLFEGFDALYQAEGRGVERGDVGGHVHPFLQGVSGYFAGLLRGEEAAVGDNYTNASDASAGIYGGITNDANCTFNYYINKYMIARLRYSYTNVRDRRVNDLTVKRHVNLIEARLQIIF